MIKNAGSNPDREDSFIIPDIMMDAMKHLNFWMLFFVLFIISRALWGYVNEGGALSFLIKANGIPEQPIFIIISTCVLYICFLILLSMEAEQGIWYILKLTMETYTVIWICRNTGFCYTGMFFMILADQARKPLDRWNRNLTIIIIGLCYFLTESRILSIWLPIVSLDDCLLYYTNSYAGIIKSLINMGQLLNTFLFISYMIALVRIQRSENARIRVLNEQLKDANIKLEEYSKESALMAQTQERNRLAREIHDTIGHSLTGIVTGIEACIVLFDKDSELVKKQLNAIAEVARRGMEDVRRSVRALKPDGLEKLPLDLAIENMIDEMGRSTGINLTYDCSVTLRNVFGEDEEEAVFRTVQEGITNSIRHGKPENIHISVSRKDSRLKITVKDDGVGCMEPKKGFGLTHMEERINMLGGSVYYDGTDGFLLEAEIPIRWGTEVNKADD